MQTFLPYADFMASAKVLDRQRLGKQRVEAWQILQILLGKPAQSRWENHPAVWMWRGHAEDLVLYGIEMCREWVFRGYRDTLWDRFAGIPFIKDSTQPRWLGDPDFHVSHQSNLLRKDFEYYKYYWPDIPANLPYIWPDP